MATLEQIQAQLKKLQAQAEALLANKAQAAIDQIRDLMLKHGLTTADIEAKAKVMHVAKGLKVSPAAGKTRAAPGDKPKSVPKYQHPKTGATWTGRGRAPAWLANVRDRNKFLIAGDAGATVAATAGAVSKANAAVNKTASKSVGATAGKGQRKGPQPAMYREPKSGATWSGRGRAPAWLSDAKDRSKFLIDGASGGADSAAASKPKAVAKKPATTIAVAKKAPVRKLVGAKKAVTKLPVATAPEAVTAQATA
jgi:DNA-binding protein H-NS